MAPGVPQNLLMTNDFPTSKLYIAEAGMHLANEPVPSDDTRLSSRNYAGLGNMSLTAKKSVEVIGVILADDRAIGKSNVNTPESGAIVLGTICIDNLKISLDELRRFMCAELPYVPAAFNFLSKDGWPILKMQEHKINTSHVIRDNNCICIKKEFEKPRVGIVTSGGDSVGFVFTDLNINIKQLRETIEQQLKISQQLRLEYRFLERNGWPIMTSQESLLSLLDVMLGQIVRIQNGERNCTILENVRPTSLMLTSTNNPIDNRLPSPSQESTEHDQVKRKKSLKFSRDSQSSMKARKESEKRSRSGKEVKPILISYVRAEAAQYALDLKSELVAMGFRVYLDVHEIKTGSDWQDALNHAVTTCFLFVPLITPMYGKTVWTNREVKLADVLGKKIIPINFMEHWPPPCLAIQFASTQYIPWKLQESDHVKEPEKPSDSKHWDSICVRRVARQIADSYNYLKLPKRSISIKEVKTTELTSEYYSCTPVKEDFNMEDGKQKIVISAHPRQRYLAEDLKSMFEKSGHEVWCSVDLLDSQMNLGSEDITNMDPNTPRNLPTIQEGDVFFSQNEEVIYSSFGDKKSLTSMKEQETFGRRPLSRLMSQFSDISQPSTLSREKLDHLKTFQKKVDEASVIIVLVSEAYTKSTFSHQQVFYCEHRKRVVLVKCDAAPIPKWFRLLMGNDMIPKYNNPQFDCVLKARVKRAINPSSLDTPKDATSEAKVNYLVNFLKRNLPLQDMCVYITGSSKLQTQRAEEICRAIGRELAKVEKISLVTGGFYGAADITAKTFNEYRENNAPFSSEESAVVHILPIHDPEDLSAKARQNLDGSFEAVPYGKTMFLGDSLKERETVAARLLDTCIVIEGGPGVVHEVEEFIWNDHFVIPIMSTGGAAGGQYGVPVKIFEIPPGVDGTDWSVLSEKDATPEEVAKAVVNIMTSLKKALASPPNTLKKSTAILKRKSRRKLLSRRQDLQEIELVPVPNKIPVSAMRNVYEIRESSEVSQSSSDEPSSIGKVKRSWWRRFLNALKHKN